jgi:xanthine/CO dehydrogenase XdhC/CoxF family maturation factor
MLMTQEGEMVGSISGGCLEGDAFEHAKKVMQSGEPVLVNYDTSADDDTVWGLGLGCAGVVHVLIESLDEAYYEYLQLLSRCLKEQKSGVVGTIFAVQGIPNAKVGSRLILNDKGEVTSKVENKNLNDAMLKDATEVLESGRSLVKEYETPEGKAEVSIESIQPPLPLLIFGAGHDAIPVVRLAKELGWNVTVVDSREAFLSKRRFPQADQLVVSDPAAMKETLPINRHTLVILMTHNYLHDLNIMRYLSKTKVRYLGVLGPKRRTEKLLQDLAKEGISLSQEQFQSLHSPAGLDIGAETPEEIAFAILSEIQAALTGRSAGMLRERKGPIH